MEHIIKIVIDGKPYVTVPETDVCGGCVFYKESHDWGYSGCRVDGQIYNGVVVDTICYQNQSIYAAE